MKMVIPTLFGLEGIVADELKWHKFQYVQADNGKEIHFAETIEFNNVKEDIKQ